METNIEEKVVENTAENAEERHPIEKWSSFFTVIGYIVISIAVLDLLIGFGDERFVTEVGFYYTHDEFSAALFWAYLVATTLPATLSGTGLVFAGKFINFVVDFYEKVCEIESKLKN